MISPVTAQPSSEQPSPVNSIPPFAGSPATHGAGVGVGVGSGGSHRCANGVEAVDQYPLAQVPPPWHAPVTVFWLLMRTRQVALSPPFVSWTEGVAHGVPACGPTVQNAPQ